MLKDRRLELVNLCLWTCVSFQAAGSCDKVAEKVTRRHLNTDIWPQWSCSGQSWQSLHSTYNIQLASDKVYINSASIEPPVKLSFQRNKLKFHQRSNWSENVHAPEIRVNKECAQIGNTKHESKQGKNFTLELFQGSPTGQRRRRRKGEQEVKRGHHTGAKVKESQIAPYFWNQNAIQGLKAEKAKNPFRSDEQKLLESLKMWALHCKGHISGHHPGGCHSMNCWAWKGGHSMPWLVSSTTWPSGRLGVGGRSKIWETLGAEQGTRSDLSFTCSLPRS